jgi:CRP/FNR family transcriptional regulator, dissimilatory nitrate respiration regulator
MDYTQLTLSPLFRNLTAADIGELLSGVPCRLKKFRAGEVIARRGDVVGSLQFVTSGVVKGEMVDETGKVIKIEDIPAPGALATAFLFGNRNRYPVNVVALSDVELLIIEKAGFLKLLMKNDLILINFLNMISNRSQFLSEKIRFLNFKTIKSKLAHYILQIAEEKNSTDIVLNITQNELADFFAVARPSVSRALGELEDEGFLEASGKNIRILDKKRLAGLTAD